MFDLNDFGNKIFNNGNAGVAENVSIKLEERGIEEPDNRPDFKLIFTDVTGATINKGFYYFKKRNDKTEEENIKLEKSALNEVVDAARSIASPEHIFPKFNTSLEAIKYLVNFIKSNSENKKVDIYVNYGTKMVPNKYLQVRKFNYIAPVGYGKTILKVNDKDLLERIQKDEPKNEGDSTYKEIEWSNEI